MCNDDWFDGNKMLQKKKWNDDDGIPHISGSIKVKKEKVAGFLGAEAYKCKCAAWHVNIENKSPKFSRDAVIRIAYFKSSFREEPYNQAELEKTLELPIHVYNCSLNSINFA